jgi:hypothetical protein
MCLKSTRKTSILVEDSLRKQTFLRVRLSSAMIRAYTSPRPKLITIRRRTCQITLLKTVCPSSNCQVSFGSGSLASSRLHVHVHHAHTVESWAAAIGSGRISPEIRRLPSVVQPPLTTNVSYTNGSDSTPKMLSSRPFHYLRSRPCPSEQNDKQTSHDQTPSRGRPSYCHSF